MSRFVLSPLVVSPTVFVVLVVFVRFSLWLSLLLPLLVGVGGFCVCVCVLWLVLGAAFSVSSNRR